MKTIVNALLLGSLLALPISLRAADEPKAEKPAAAAKEAKVTGRLPQYYGKAGVDAAQKKKIYEIQAKFKSKIDALEKEMEELKSQQETEIRAVLTPAQLKQVEEMIAKAKNAKKAVPSPDTGASR